MHECNGIAKFVSHASAARALCLSSQSAPFMMPSTRRKCGTDEGQMRDLIGHLVAPKGAEVEAARIAVGSFQEFLRRDGVDRVHALIDKRSIDAAAFTRDPATLRVVGGAATDSPITIAYASEDIPDPANLQIAGAINGFGLFD
jgi:hypothetical protein